MRASVREYVIACLLLLHSAFSLTSPPTNKIAKIIIRREWETRDDTPGTERLRYGFVWRGMNTVKVFRLKLKRITLQKFPCTAKNFTAIQRYVEVTNISHWKLRHTVAAWVWGLVSGKENRGLKLHCPPVYSLLLSVDSLWFWFDINRQVYPLTLTDWATNNPAIHRHRCLSVYLFAYSKVMPRF